MSQKKYNLLDPEPSIVAESRSPYGLKTYVSLFSSAGVGCYGFKQENFYCIATVELLERRLKIQKYNQKCAYDSGYICGDMTQKKTQERVFEELDLWKRNFNVKDFDVIVATPPCQGMSVENHKKKDELKTTKNGKTTDKNGKPVSNAPNSNLPTPGPSNQQEDTPAMPDTTAPEPGGGIAKGRN